MLKIGNSQFADNYNRITRNSVVKELGISDDLNLVGYEYILMDTVDKYMKTMSEVELTVFGKYLNDEINEALSFIRKKLNCNAVVQGVIATPLIRIMDNTISPLTLPISINNNKCETYNIYSYKIGEGVVIYISCDGKILYVFGEDIPLYYIISYMLFKKITDANISNIIDNYFN